MTVVDRLFNAFGRVALLVLDSLNGPGGQTLAKRTICCDQEMWDLWMHADDCPVRLYILLEMKQNRNWKRHKGLSDRCFNCGFIPHVTGDKCIHCNHVEDCV